MRTLRKGSLVRDGMEATANREDFAFLVQGWRVPIVRTALDERFHCLTSSVEHMNWRRRWSSFLRLSLLSAVAPRIVMVLFYAEAEGYGMRCHEEDGQVRVVATPASRDGLPPGIRMLSGSSFTDDGHEAVRRGEEFAFIVVGWRVRVLRRAFPLYLQYIRPVANAGARPGLRGRWGILRFGVLAMWTPVLWAVLFNAGIGRYTISCLDQADRLFVIAKPPTPNP